MAVKHCHRPEAFYQILTNIDPLVSHMRRQWAIKKRPAESSRHTLVEVEHKFSFLKEGLPSLKTACLLCKLGTPPNLVIFTLH